MPSPSDELQLAIINALIADPAVSAIVGDRVYDARPTAYPCVTFGPGDCQPDDAECITGRVETVQLDCWTTDTNGRLGPARILTNAVKAALHHAELELETHALVQITVPSVRVFQEPDDITVHGVVTVEALIEELA